jgi:imidazolonepropionase-like amidohydrolase
LPSSRNYEAERAKRKAKGKRSPGGERVRRVREGVQRTMKSVYGKVIYTGKKVVEHAYLAFAGPRVEGIFSKSKGEELGRFEVLTPAFIDPHSHLGMARSGEPDGEAEANEEMDTILALSDALDSVQMDDAAFREAVEMGVLYSCVVPGSGNIIGGLSAVIRNYAKYQ